MMEHILQSTCCDPLVGMMLITCRHRRLLAIRSRQLSMSTGQGQIAGEGDSSTVIRSIALGLAFAVAMFAALIGLTVLTDRLAFVASGWGATARIFSPAWWRHVWFVVAVAVTISAVYVALRDAVRGIGLLPTGVTAVAPIAGAWVYYLNEDLISSFLAVRPEEQAAHIGWVLARWWVILSVVIGVFAIGRAIVRYWGTEPPVPYLLVPAGVIGTMVVWLAYQPVWIIGPIHGGGARAFFGNVAIILPHSLIGGLLIGLALAGVWLGIDHVRGTYPTSNR